MAKVSFSSDIDLCGKSCRRWVVVLVLIKFSSFLNLSLVHLLILHFMSVFSWTSFLRSASANHSCLRTRHPTNFALPCLLCSDSFIEIFNYMSITKKTSFWCVCLEIKIFIQFHNDSNHVFLYTRKNFNQIYTLRFQRVKFTSIHSLLFLKSIKQCDIFYLSCLMHIVLSYGLIKATLSSPYTHQGHDL